MKPVVCLKIYTHDGHIDSHHISKIQKSNFNFTYDFKY